MLSRLSLATALLATAIEAQWVPGEVKSAYCRLEYNPAYTTTYPQGYIKLQQAYGLTSLVINGWMKSLPSPDAKHGFSVNWTRWDKKDCASAGSHLNPTNKPHGKQNARKSHIGDLQPIQAKAGDAAFQYSSLILSLFGPPYLTKRSMVLYAQPDDLGLAGTDASKLNGSVGREIACCNIIGYEVIDLIGVPDNALIPKIKKRRLDDIDGEEEIEVFTPQEYKEFFGEDYDPYWAAKFIELNQNFLN